MTDLAENSAAQAHEPFRAILIAGPTASGKSALALRLAKAYGGEVINADSMQVYSGLRVITACPSGEEEAQAPAPSLPSVGPDNCVFSRDVGENGAG